MPDGVRDLIRSQQCAVKAIGDLRCTHDEVQLENYDAVVIANTSADDQAGRSDALRELLSRLDRNHTSTLVLGDEPGQTPAAAYHVKGLRRIAPAQATAEELWGRLYTLVSLQPWVQQMESELDRLQTVGSKLSSHFTELDQEMRLASRLQHDLLPRELPTTGPVRFAAIYRPASWVSGDIYDVFWIDDRHVAFYVVDAVGHGVAASLLTMFVQYALLKQRVGKNPASALSPAINICAINDALAEQQLPNCQFVTACYCVLDTQTMQLTVARGGHPYPIHIRKGGTLEEIKTTGALLGIFTDQKYTEATVQLAPGDKVALFSDGVELEFVETRDPQSGAPVYEQHFQAVSDLPATEMIQQLGTTLDNEAGSLNPRDDVTIVVVEVEADD
jgi:serine phosphatase RsbU (regulator of sigma subunit)